MQEMSEERVDGEKGQGEDLKKEEESMVVYQIKFIAPFSF